MQPLTDAFPSSSQAHRDASKVTLMPSERHPARILDRAVWLHFPKGMMKHQNNKWHWRGPLIRGKGGEWGAGREKPVLVMTLKRPCQGANDVWRLSLQAHAW